MRTPLALVVALLLSACGSAANARATESMHATETASVSRATEAALAARATNVAGTQAAIRMATQAAAPMAEVVDRLRAEGVLTSSEGSFTQLMPFDESWAQLNWYSYFRTGLAPTDFVLRASASWDSASDRADWWNSGCGLVFRESNVDNHYIVHLGLDGNAYLARFRNGVPAQLGYSYYGPLDVPAGSASIMLVVQGNQFTFYVNDEQVLQRQDSAHPNGNLAYTLVSGTNKGFGTRCQLNDVQLWTLD